MAGAGRTLGYGEGKEALLRATVRVVATKGLRGLTFRAVAEEAGVTNTLIAHHFGSRDNLLAAALDWSADRSIAAADLSEYATDAAAYRAALVENVLSDPDVEIFQFEMILESSRRPELQPAIRGLYRRYVADLAAGRALLRQPGTDALDLALFAALDGLMLQFLSRAITADQLADAVDALADAVNMGHERVVAD
ncbi:TetR/AcrR family transcriptional regulator [Isoptericola sp. BMS4]|uniref:TetR/AcrR family transcriptional regulator n=1 Tax=Isoptericola sp. BMS4 TaxID=2527875 RepID=UPI001F0E7EB2|nr:TetR family transcriptional regulator [Isoptericola sp. BMS4]